MLFHFYILFIFLPYPPVDTTTYLKQTFKKSTWNAFPDRITLELSGIECAATARASARPKIFHFNRSNSSCTYPRIDNKNYKELLGFPLQGLDDGVDTIDVSIPGQWFNSGDMKKHANKIFFQKLF